MTRLARPPARSGENAETDWRAVPCRFRDDRPVEEDTMERSLRPIASILLLAGLVLTLAAPAAAAPRAEPLLVTTVPGLRLVAELWAWAGVWFGESPIESVWAAGGGMMDPDGEPLAVAGPVPAPDDTERPGDTGASGPGV